MQRVIDIDLKLEADYVTRQSVIKEGNVRFSLTPYDIPRSARVIWDDVNHILTIEFLYLTPDEPRRVIRVNDDIELSIGQFSNKLYSARVGNIQTPTNGLDGLISALENARRGFDINRPKDRLTYWNYSLAKDFLSEEENRRLASLAL